MPRNESENWVEGKTGEGLTYYYNSMTGGRQGSNKMLEVLKVIEFGTLKFNYLNTLKI